MKSPFIKLHSMLITASLCIGALLLLSSCSVLVPDPESGYKSEQYEFSFDRPGWSRSEPEGSDYAFTHNQTGSILLINSLCGKYESSPLKYLLENLLMGIDEISIEKREELTFVERKAVRAYASGMLDGVKVHVLIQTVRKNHCIYDFVLISRKAETIKQLENDYFKLLDTVSIK